MGSQTITFYLPREMIQVSLEQFEAFEKPKKYGLVLSVLESNYNINNIPKRYFAEASVFYARRGNYKAAKELVIAAGLTRKLKGLENKIQETIERSEALFNEADKALEKPDYYSAYELEFEGIDILLKAGLLKELLLHQNTPEFDRIRKGFNRARKPVIYENRLYLGDERIRG